jgi:hypothetical protein
MASKKPNGGPRDLTTEILVQIRDEMRQMREDLRRLEKRQSDDATRLSTELVGVAKAVLQVRDLLREQRIERERVEDHEKRIRALEKKAG